MKSLIFMSHSNKDIDGQSFFDRLLSRYPSDLLPFWYSYEGPQPPHADKIFATMKESKALVVVLSEHMSKPHTLSWVGYEVGLAKALGKPIYVFEYAHKSASNIPVPGLTGYIQRPTVSESKTEFPGEEVLYSIETAQYLIFKNGHNIFWDTKCPYEDCKAEYHLFLTDPKDIFNCPSCRRKVKIFPIMRSGSDIILLKKANDEK